MSIFSTYTQGLKQLGFSLDTLEDVEPAIFTFMDCTVFKNSPPSPGFIRSILQMLVGLGADINARWQGSPPLVYLFGIHECIHRDDEEANMDAEESDMDAEESDTDAEEFDMDDEESDTDDGESDTDDEESKTTIVTEIVIVLLESGTDLLALSDDGVSVFDVAEYYGGTSELALALQETGYDFDEVRHKIRLAQWRLRNPGHSLAESTAVDHSQIEPPSKAGLVSRRAIAGDRLEE